MTTTDRHSVRRDENGRFQESVGVGKPLVSRLSAEARPGEEDSRHGPTHRRQSC